ncbi:MAG: alpha/beta fold hydrolase [Elainellaceae cyanobacterium]
MEQFVPPWWLRNGWSMTLYAAWRLEKTQIEGDRLSKPVFDHIFLGEGQTPLYGQVALPPSPAGQNPDHNLKGSSITGSERLSDAPQVPGTIIATYGITGSLGQQRSLDLLRQKALKQGFSVILFDWRAHGKSAELSSTLTSDGLYEGKDFIHIAAQAKALGCPSPFWFLGFSLGGQLALWAMHSASLQLAETLGLSETDIGGTVAICPNLDSNRSLDFLVRSPLGRWLEQSITAELKRLAHRLHDHHPDAFDLEAIARANSIFQFDQELVIPRLGFDTVEEYYTASSPLPWLHAVTRPTLVLYAKDDPMFDPAIVNDLEHIQTRASEAAAPLDLWMTEYGGHVGYFSGHGSPVAGRIGADDADPWWAWNRVVDWIAQPHLPLG